MQNVHVDHISRNVPRLRVDLCNEDHHYESRGNYAHHCPTLALQRAIKARGYRVDRYETTLFVRTTLQQYRRLFYPLQRKVEAKYEAWRNRAAVVDTWRATSNIVKVCKSEAEASAFIDTLPDARLGRYNIDVNGAHEGSRPAQAIRARVSA